MSLTALVDQIDTLVSNAKPTSDIKAALLRLRDQIEALETSYKNAFEVKVITETTYSGLLIEHKKLEAEHSALKKAHTDLQNSQPPPATDWPGGDIKPFNPMPD